ncbi:MAG: hypothetical protein IPJ11_05550 [Gemmatimonadetes bacterium]|nr:hypothetical protein [Gemmatimonadota bacterium]
MFIFASPMETKVTAPAVSLAAIRLAGRLAAFDRIGLQHADERIAGDGKGEAALGHDRGGLAVFHAHTGGNVDVPRPDEGMGLGGEGAREEEEGSKQQGTTHGEAAPVRE